MAPVQHCSRARGNRALDAFEDVFPALRISFTDAGQCGIWELPACLIGVQVGITTGVGTIVSTAICKLCWQCSKATKSPWPGHGYYKVSAANEDSATKSCLFTCDHKFSRATLNGDMAGTALTSKVR
jgi:hypothetical protein